MSNMSYCRFQNTVDDMIDCQNHLEQSSEEDKLSKDETYARKRLLLIAVELVINGVELGLLLPEDVEDLNDCVSDYINMVKK